MKLSNLQKRDVATKRRRRVGRGPGSGLGKTCGRGQKGYKSRSGSKKRPGFEGGQMPLHRRLPKFGFTNIFRTEYTVVNLESLEKSDFLGTGDVVTKAMLRSKNIIRTLNRPVKLLARGELSKAVKIEVDKASRTAVEKVRAVGGEVVLPSK